MILRHVTLPGCKPRVLLECNGPMKTVAFPFWIIKLMDISQARPWERERSLCAEMLWGITLHRVVGESVPLDMLYQSVQGPNLHQADITCAFIPTKHAAHGGVSQTISYMRDLKILFPMELRCTDVYTCVVLLCHGYPHHRPYSYVSCLHLDPAL